MTVQQSKISEEIPFRSWDEVYFFILRDRRPKHVNICSSSVNSNRTRPTRHLECVDQTKSAKLMVFEFVFPRIV